MNDLKDLFIKYKIKPLGYTFKNSVVIVRTKDDKFVFKRRNKDNRDLFNYLKLKGFNYCPFIYNMDSDDKYDIYKYYEDYNISNNLKAIDLINIIGLLHSKTNYYKDVSKDDYKIIYENIDKQIKDLNNYYDNLFKEINSHDYMSPSEYLLIRNITVIFSLLNNLNYELNSWYDLIKDSNKMRVCYIHNNLSLDHFIRNEKSYLISWDNALIDMPIYDLYSFYINNYLDVDFNEILFIYEKYFPLLLEEKKLLFLLISIPNKIDFTNDEYDNTKKVTELLSYINKTFKVVSKYYSKK